MIPATGQPSDSGIVPGQSHPTRPRTWPDPLYGTVRLANWAALLLAAPPFARLAGGSLSDVPGELLFGRPFPSRLDHMRGAYHLARLARPRDRTLQAAALAHDVGHGPLSHICEPIMREWLGGDHEARAARQLAAVRAALPQGALRHLEWLDWNEVAALVVGAGADARGALLNGPLDYDNLDNVARFGLASGLIRPAYDGVGLARALRLAPGEAAPEDASVGTDEPVGPVYLLASAEADALAWQAARRRIYDFLHGDHRNLAPHAMLRKAVELAFADNTLPTEFLDMTDAQALDSLAGSSHRGVATLIARVRARGYEQHHTCLWEAAIPNGAPAADALGTWRKRLSLEAELASEAGLGAHEVIIEAVVSRAGRALPPFSASGRSGTFTRLPAPPPAPYMLHLFVAAHTPRDYQRRLRAAAERRLGGLGVAPPAGGDGL